MPGKVGRPPKYDYKRIESAMRMIITREDKRFPTNDKKLHYLIEDKGIPCSAHSIVWLRRKLGIPASHKRKVER